MSKAVKYFILGFKNAFGGLSFKDFGGYEYGELTSRIAKKRKENLEALYGKRQANKKPKQSA
ncbi:MAG: hypothetical protein LUC34_02245 [Campylobacter sp.]|nr:hypothetical protein [Campylobacter sp.]